MPPPDDFWTPDRDLLAAVVDGLRILAWQNTEDGHEGRNIPEPLPRPGFEKPEAPAPVDPRVARRRLAEMAGRSGGRPDDPGADQVDEPQRTEDAES
ncbi:DUF5361 domain-containing protein [Cellulomonas shaoxiangyii]|uniref:DUF5361 domain-containing protein n=1 Tax=Cellulomonas shaoxiangyii TaxID=2566013 RepID=UPI003C7AABA0